jgi:hypothetical protein
VEQARRHKGVFFSDQPFFCLSDLRAARCFSLVDEWVGPLCDFAERKFLSRDIVLLVYSVCGTLRYNSPLRILAIIVNCK